MRVFSLASSFCLSFSSVIIVSGATGAMYKMQRLRKYPGKEFARQIDIAWQSPLADSSGGSFPMSEAWAVITTINPPTKSLQLLAEIPNLRLCVVADHKSPKDYELPGAVYLTPDMQVRNVPLLFNFVYLSRLTCG
jgi:hypothetical protein